MEPVENISKSEMTVRIRVEKIPVLILDRLVV